MNAIDWRGWLKPDPRPDSTDVIMHQTRTIDRLRRENACLRGGILSARRALWGAVHADPADPMRDGWAHIREAHEIILTIDLGEEPS